PSRVPALALVGLCAAAIAVTVALAVAGAGGGVGVGRAGGDRVAGEGWAGRPEPWAGRSEAWAGRLAGGRPATAPQRHASEVKPTAPQRRAREGKWYNIVPSAPERERASGWGRRAAAVAAAAQSPRAAEPRHEFYFTRARYTGVGRGWRGR